MTLEAIHLEQRLDGIRIRFRQFLLCWTGRKRGQRQKTQRKNAHTTKKTGSADCEPSGDAAVIAGRGWAERIHAGSTSRVLRGTRPKSSLPAAVTLNKLDYPENRIR